jgi:ketosteroid isomerase-like protein
LTKNHFPSQDDQVMTPFDDPQAELAWMFLQSMCEGGDLDEGFALLSDDFTFWTIASRNTCDKAALRRGVERRKERFEVNVDLIRCVNEGETVVVEGEADGVSVDGTKYDSPFLCIFETRDGMIASLREYSDTQSLARVFP